MKDTRGIHYPRRWDHLCKRCDHKMITKLTPIQERLLYVSLLWIFHFLFVSERRRTSTLPITHFKSIELKRYWSKVENGAPTRLRHPTETVVIRDWWRTGGSPFTLSNWNRRCSVRDPRWKSREDYYDILEQGT